METPLSGFDLSQYCLNVSFQHILMVTKAADLIPRRQLVRSVENEFFESVFLILCVFSSVGRIAFEPIVGWRVMRTCYDCACIEAVLSYSESQDRSRNAS
jgi:hypothetical protein